MDLDVDQAKLEEELNRVLLDIVKVQDEIWDELDQLERIGRLSPLLEELVRSVMKDVDYWTCQCTCASESPPILLRRMQIHFKRLQRIASLIEDAKNNGSGNLAHEG